MSNFWSFSSMLRRRSPRKTYTSTWVRYTRRSSKFPQSTSQYVWIFSMVTQDRYFPLYYHLMARVCSLVLWTILSWSGIWLTENVWEYSKVTQKQYYSFYYHLMARVCSLALLTKPLGCGIWLTENAW